jgi:hypothetical protein
MGNPGSSMERHSYSIVEVFDITHRGTVIVIDDVIGLKGGKPIHVRITGPDGAAFDAVGFVERLLRRVPTVIEKTALLLQDVPIDAVSVGATMTVLDRHDR